MLVIDRPGKIPLSVPLEKAQGLRPGQCIPTDEEGYFFAKMETGRCKVLKDVTSTKTTFDTGPPSGFKEFKIPSPRDDAQSESDSDSDSDSGKNFANDEMHC